MTKAGERRLRKAARTGKTRRVRIYAKKAASGRLSLDAPDKGGNSAAHLAAASDHGGVLSVLAASGASMGLPNGRGVTPLGVAAACGSAGAVGALTALPRVEGVVEDGEVVGVVAGAALVGPDGGESEEPPLVVAAKGGRDKVVEVLLAAGAHPDGGEGGRRGRRKRSALHWAAARGHVAVVALLLEYGADPYAVSARGEGILEIAANGTAAKLVRQAQKEWDREGGRVVKKIGGRRNTLGPWEGVGREVADARKSALGLFLQTAPSSIPPRRKKRRRRRKKQPAPHATPRR